MKLVNHANKLESNAEFTSQEFGIGNASVVIEILRNRLYKHKIRTLVQEYISNGRDAMREIKSKDTLQVTIPTLLEPTFKVRDFGPGISPDRMSSVFVLYGASTKRDSNNQTGGFGIGAKSAWAYTDSFTIVSFTDGTKRTYVAHTGSNNNGRLDCISIEPTKEPNGTEIQIAAAPRDVNAFRDAVFRATYFWSETDKVEILGVPKDHIPTKAQGYTVTDTLETYTDGTLRDVTGQHQSNPLLIIDGIPYVLSDEIVNKHDALSKLKKVLKDTLVFYVDNGVVEVSASREEISDSDFSNKAISKLAKTAFGKVDAMIKAEFAKAKTVQEKLKTYMELTKEYNVEDYRNIGQYTINYGKLQGGMLDMVTLERVSVDHDGTVSKDDMKGKSRRRYSSRNVNTLEAEDFGTLFFVDIEESAVAQNHRIREYFETNHRMILVKKVINNGQNTTTSQADLDKAYDTILSDLSVKPISTLTVTPKPKAPRVIIQRDKKQFCIHTFRGSYRKDKTHTTLADNTQKYLYLTLEEFSGSKGELYRELNTYLTEGGSGFEICGLGDDSIRRVKGDKNFKPLREWLDAYAPNDVAVRSYIKLEVAKNQSIVERISKINGLKCKILNKAIKAYSDYSGTVVPVPTVLVDKIKSHKEIAEFAEIDKELTKVLKDEYPLVAEVSSSRPALIQELKWYINAKA